jgi:dolichyl-phosphate beta-glucosyltransferase
VLTAQSRSAPRARGASPVEAVREPVTLEIVIPALNEEERLPRTLERTLDYLGQQPYSAAVVVVDNGSRDRTTDVARAFGGAPVPVHVLDCPRPGKGSAVRAGFRTSAARWVGFMDADLATPIETLDTVMPLLQTGSSAVIGSRHAPGAHLAVPQGALRRLGGNTFRAAARSLVPGVEDTQCGFKFFDGRVGRWLAGVGEVDGFSFDVEFLARLQRAGHRLDEVGVVWSDVEGSSFSPLRDGARSFTDTLRIHWLLAAERRSRTASVRVTRRPVLGSAVASAA